MQRLKQAFSFSWLTNESTTTKVHLTGTSPRSVSPLCRQSSTWDTRTKIQSSHDAHAKDTFRKKETTCRPAPSNIHIPTALRKLACTSCQNREVKGEKIWCSNYRCRRCGDRKVSVIRGNKGLCQDCAGEVEGHDVILKTGKEMREGRERGETYGPNPLAGPSLVQEIEAHRRAEEVIEASTSSTSSLCSMTAAIGFGERKRDAEAERARLGGGVNLRTTTKSKKWKLNLTNFCGGGGWGIGGDQGCGSVLTSGEDISIRTCSDESLVLISVDQEPAYETVIFNAAQIGSPTGLAYATWPCPPFKKSITGGKDEEIKDGETSTWPSPHLRALIESGEAANLEESAALLSKEPRLFLRKGNNLQLELAEAMNTPISPLAITRGSAVPPNRSNDEPFLSASRSTPIPIPTKSSKHQRQMSELNIPPPAHLDMCHESPPTSNRTEQLKSLSSGSSLPQPASFLIKSSLDSSFSLPASLADSMFCDELIRTLSIIPEGMERVRDTATQTYALSSPPKSLFLANLPGSLRSIAHREALESNLPRESPISESSPPTKSLLGSPIYPETGRRSRRIRPDSPRPRDSFEFSSNSSPRSCSSISQAMASPPLSPDSEVSEFPEDLPCEEYRAKLTRNFASTHLSTMASFPILRSSPTPSPSPVSDRSFSSVLDRPLMPFLFEPPHFQEDRILYPHPHPHRTPSPALTPYPSLSSSASSLDYEVHPTLEGLGLSKSILSRVCTPPPRDNRQGLGEWSNEKVSLLGTTPEFVCVKGGKHGERSSKAVRVRGGGIQRTKRQWKVGNHVTTKIRKAKDRLEYGIATEKVKTELARKWKRRAYHMGFVIVGMKMPIKMKARRREKNDHLGKWRLGLAKDERKGKARA